MRPLKIIGIVLILITGPVMLESCCLATGSCGCGSGNFEPFFDIDTMELSVWPRPSTTSPLQSPILSEVRFSISLRARYSEVRSLSGYSAYACSPAPRTANQKPTDVVITSDHALITTLGTVTAGQSLNSLFKVYADNFNRDPIESLINGELTDGYLEFRSDEKATVGETHIFTIVITLDDGRTFTMKSDPVTISLG